MTINTGNLDAYSLSTSASAHTWFAIKGSGFTVAATLGPVILGSSNVNFQFNSHSTGAADLIDWTNLVPGLTFASGTYFELDSTGTTTVTLPGVTASVSGFALVRETGVAGPTGTGTGTAFKLELDGTNVNAGAGGLTLTLAGGTLQVYGFAVGTASWVALDGTGFAPTIQIGPLTISSGSFGFTLNTESGTATPITDWSFGNLGGPTLVADSFDVTADTFAMSLTGFVSISAGHIDLSREQGVDPDGTGPIGSGTAVAAHLADVSLTADFGGATLVLNGSNSLDFYYFANGAGSWTAMSGTGFDVGVTVGNLSASASGATFAVNTRDNDVNPEILNWAFARGPPTSNPTSFSSGEYFDVGASSASFSFDSLAAATGSFDLSRETSGSDSLLTFSLHNASAFVGLGAKIDAGVATGDSGLSATGGSIDVAIATVAGNQHIAAAGADLAGSINGLSSLTAKISGGKFAITDGFNWANTSFTSLPSTITTLPTESTDSISGRVALGVTGVVDVVGGVTIAIDKAAQSFAFTISNPEAFVGFGGSLTGTSTDGSDWHVSPGTGFSVNGAGGSVSVYALNGHVGVLATNLAVSLAGISAVTAKIAGFNASYNDGTDFSSVDGLAASSSFNTLNGFTASAAAFALGVTGVVDVVGGVTIAIDKAAQSFAFTISNPEAFVGFGGSLTGTSTDGSDWHVSPGTGFSVNGAGGSVSVYALNGHVGVLATNLAVSLAGISAVTAKIAGFNASYNDGTDFSSVDGLAASSSFNTLNGFTASAAAFALGVTGVVDVVGGVTIAIDKAAQSFAFTISNPEAFVGFGGSLTGTSTDGSDWHVSPGTGFSVNGAGGSVSVYALNGHVGVLATNLAVSLAGISAVTAKIAGFNASYNDGTDFSSVDGLAASSSFNTLNGFTASAAAFALGVTGVVDVVGGVTIAIDKAAQSFAFTISNPEAFVGFGGSLTGTSTDGSDWHVSPGTGFSVNGAGGSVSVYALNGHVGVLATNLAVSLAGISAVTAKIAGFNASYNDGTDFSSVDGLAASSSFNTLNGFTASAAAFALGVTGVVDVVGGVTIAIDKAAQSFAFTISNPEAFVGFGGSLTGTSTDGSDWHVSPGTGFSVNGAGGSVSVYALNGHVGVLATNLAVSLAGISAVTAKIAGFNASYNDGTDFSSVDGLAASSSFNTLNGFTASAKIAFSLESFVNAVGTFDVNARTVSGNSLLTFTLTDPQLFVGVGSSLSDTSNDGTGWAVSTPTSAIGLGVSQGTLALAVATIGGTEHVALVASGLAGSLQTGTSPSVLSLSVTGGSATVDADGFDWKTGPGSRCRRRSPPSTAPSRKS